MKIEAVCETKGLHPEYLMRVSHKELIQLGAAQFQPGEVLTMTHSIDSIENALTQLRWATRAMKDAYDIDESMKRAEKRAA